MVGILSAGEMGSAIGRTLRDGGREVATCLEGRSELTRQRARDAGFREYPSYDALVSEVDVLLSVLVPAEAKKVAAEVADSLRRTRATPAYADCNAVSPRTVKEMSRLITDAGCTFIDAGIIGPPPGPGRSTRIYCSGPDCGALEALKQDGLSIRVVGPNIGQASGLKMVYAASTKGTTALWTELLLAARALGLDDALAEELAQSRANVAQQVMASIPSVPRRSRRWIGEMEEIAATFQEVGLTPRILQGAADIYRLIGDTRLADQTPGEPNPPIDVLMETVLRHVQANREPHEETP
jgi:3-hydroxyisobutyrate dehydrogenase-like beta-hydroxyacid dehydrogenase